MDQNSPQPVTPPGFIPNPETTPTNPAAPAPANEVAFEHGPIPTTVSEPVTASDVVTTPIPDPRVTDAGSIPEPAPETTSGPSPLKQIRTFQGDIAEALKEKQASVYALQQAEKERVAAREHLAPSIKEERVQATAADARRHAEAKGWGRALLLIVGTLVLLAFGAAGIWYAYTSYQTRIASVPVTTTPSRFISVTSSYSVDATSQTKESLIQILSREENKATQEGVEQIIPRQGTADDAPLLTTQGFLSLIGASAPAALVRAFDPLFMLGFLGGTPTHTFVLIKLDSFENAFPGMLDWEGTLANDLLPIISQGGVVPTIPSNAVWEDITIQNKDARILKDAFGQTVLLYSFFNNSMLIITDTEATLRTLINKLTNQSLVR